MKKTLIVLLIVLMSLFICACDSTEEPAAEIMTKEIELFNDTLMVPEESRIEDSEISDVKYIFFGEDESDNKWKNYILVNITPGVNSTPDITYDQGRVVLADYTNQLISVQTGITNVNKSSVSVSQTPAFRITADLENGKGSYIIYTFMNSYHDIILYRFYHSNSAADDYTESFEKMIETMVFNDLADDKAFKENDYNYENETKSTSRFTNEYGTPTTKCAHPGCNNYIASSGDTNCCTMHSNRCKECYKYIDEDAIYCMSCLSKAIDGN